MTKLFRLKFEQETSRLYNIGQSDDTDWPVSHTKRASLNQLGNNFLLSDKVSLALQAGLGLSGMSDRSLTTGLCQHTQLL